MLVWSICFVTEGSTIIGIKSRHVEWARLEGRSSGFGGVSGSVGRVRLPDSDPIGEGEVPYTFSGSRVAGAANRASGSAALGLRECEFKGLWRWGFQHGASILLIRARQGNVPEGDGDFSHTALAVPGAVD